MRTALASRTPQKTALVDQGLLWLDSDGAIWLDLWRYGDDTEGAGTPYPTIPLNPRPES